MESHVYQGTEEFDDHNETYKKSKIKMVSSTI